eukprot:m.162767 g.162767  ORF g.162767 m.162767 type:complete len:347 (-) comp17097_c1_seq6:1011-2051(-)
MEAKEKRKEKEIDTSLRGKYTYFGNVQLIILFMSSCATYERQMWLKTVGTDSRLAATATAAAAATPRQPRPEGGRGRPFLNHHSRLAVAVHKPHFVAALELVLFVGRGQLVDDALVDGVVQAAGAVEHVIVAADELHNSRIPGQLNLVPLAGLLCPFVEVQLDQLAQLAAGKRCKVEHLIDAAEKLVALEVALEDRPDALFLELFGKLQRGVRIVAADIDGVVGYFVLSEVGGHDEDGVLALDGLAFAVGHAPFIKQLKKDGQNVRMGLFNLVKEHDCVRAAGELLGELAALVVSDVSWRRADEFRHLVLLLVLAHIDANEAVQILVVAVDVLADSLGKLRLAQTR